MTTITVPRATWDALISALENHPGNYKLTTLEAKVYQTILARAEVLTAANAVSQPKPETAPATEGGAITSESAANAVQPRAQGEARSLALAKQQWEHWKQYALELQERLVKYEGGAPMVLNAAHPQATEPAENEDPLQGAVDWLLQADRDFFAVANVQRTLRIGYNRAKRLADTARERAAAPEAKA